MGEYDSAVALAKRLIDKKGATVTLTKVNVTPEDSAKPWRGKTPAAADTSLTPKGVALNFLAREIGSQFTSGSITGAVDQVRRDDVKLLVAADGLGGANLREYSKATVSSRSYSIIAASPLSPGGVDVMWELLLRQ